MPSLHRLLAFAALALAACTALAAGPPEAGSWSHAPYRLGQGLTFPAQGLDFGGYLNVQYEDLAHRSRALSLRDLSLFVHKRLGERWGLFTEVELGNAATLNGETGARVNPEFDVERLYLEYRLGPAATLRLGKFLTPVGRWNMIHAAPLVWTVSRPLTATAPFARHGTGVMVYGSLPTAGHDLDYWAFVDDTALLDPRQRDEKAFDVPGSTVTVPNAFHRAVGGRLAYRFIARGLSVGLSYVHFEMEQPRDDKDLVGADFHWQIHHLELSGEAVYRGIRGWSASDERGGFLQAVVPLPWHLYLVGRRERYHAAVLAADPTIDTLGIAYRPRPPVSVKLEYRSGTHNDAVAPDGWLASLAILF